MGENLLRQHGDWRKRVDAPRATHDRKPCSQFGRQHRERSCAGQWHLRVAAEAVVILPLHADDLDHAADAEPEVDTERRVLRLILSFLRRHQELSPDGCAAESLRRLAWPGAPGLACRREHSDLWA